MAEPSDPFELAIDALVAREFEESPLMAAAMGRDGFDHRLDDCTAAGFERRAADDRLWLQRFSDMDPEGLSSEQVIDRALVIATLDRRVALTGWAEWRRSPEGYLETGITELFLLAIRTEDELTEAAVARLNGIGSVLDEAAENLDPSLASRLIVERSLAQCVANIGFARNDVCQLASAPGNQDRLRAAGEVGARAYEKFAQFLRGLAPTCTGSYEFGEDRYNDVLRRGELLDTDVRALRQQGWEEYHEVAGAMATVAARLADGSTDWPAVVRRLQQVHPTSISDMRDGYEAVCLEARRFMVDHHLVTNPPD
ncbi:MAG TPA: DUF885 family protein, partial [Acidimicrobiales bacterium]|nr:DUF885 family protein [Acidimicrobiales bacterium]